MWAGNGGDQTKTTVEAFSNYEEMIWTTVQALE